MDFTRNTVAAHAECHLLGFSMFSFPAAKFIILGNRKSISQQKTFSFSSIFIYIQLTNFSKNARELKSTQEMIF